MKQRTLGLAIVAAVCITFAAGGCGRNSLSKHEWRGAPVILISVDTLRADHLPAYGYKGVSTPNIDALAADSILFENAYSHVPLTLPSHVSLLTGELPPADGVRNNVGYLYDAAKHPPIGAVLKSQGYETGAAVSAYVLRGATGLSSAFDFYDGEIGVESTAALGELQRPGAATIEVAKNWIAPRSGKPFFFMLHLFEPHSPYDPPEPFRSTYAANPYDGEVAASDDLVGKFVSFLKEKGIYDKAIIIFLSDHGEGLGDHGEDEHGVFLYRETLHVPLMVKLPEGARRGERVSAPVQLTDVAPTIALATGAKPDPQMKGLSLLDAKQLEQPRRIYSETLYPRLHLGWSELRSLVDSNFHYIEAPRPELYDVKRDVAEKTNVLAENRRVYAAMRKDMEAYPKQIESMAPVSKEEAAKLAALGYIGSTVGEGTNLPDPKDHIAELGMMKDAARMAQQGRTGEAIATYRRILEANPRFTDAWSLLASTLEQAGRYDEAVAAYKEKLKLSPEMADEIGLNLGDLLLRMKRYGDAESHARLALTRNPAGAHQLLARIALAKNDWTTAETEARASMSDATLKLRSQVILAQAYEKQGRIPEAMALLDETSREATAKGVRVPTLDYTRADLFANIGKNDEAERAFLSEISNFPHNLQAYSSLSILYLVTGREAESNATLEKMFEANKTAQACDVAARTLEVTGNARGAAVWKQRAVSMR